jgi:hypothetical protein
MYIQTSKYMYIYKHTETLINIHTYIHTYTHTHIYIHTYIYMHTYILLSLAPQPSLGLGLLHKIWLNFVEASQHFFLQGRVVSPMPNLHPGGPGLCIYIPQRQGSYVF